VSGRTGPIARGTPPRVQLPLLVRLFDDSPDQARDPPASLGDAMAALRDAVRRDLEALLNARRRWLSWPAHMGELATSPLGYGIPDFTSGAFNDPRRREELRLEIEDTIRRFEPRFLSVRVALAEHADPLSSTLRLRIDGVLKAEPAPEAIAFDTIINPGSDDVLIRPARADG